MSSRFWILLARKLAGEATLDELRELEQLLLENPELAGNVELYIKYFNSQMSANPSSNAKLEQQWQRQLDLLRGPGEPEDQAVPGDSRPAKKRRMLKLALVLGVVALAVVLAGIFNVPRKQNAILSMNTPGAVASKNERIEMVLPDGSRVWLNKDSRIALDKGFGKSNREISLIGEAFFDVVHKAELPMIVHAGKVDIRVKGTAFNVCAYPDDNQVETALVRGSIELSASINGKKQRLLMKPNEKVTIHTGEVPVQPRQQVQVPEFVLDTLAVEEQSGLIPEIAWIQNKMVFVNESLDDLTGKMNKWFNTSIIIEDSSLLKERFTGVFRNEDLQEALEALRFTYGFNYSIQNDKVVITK